MSAAGAAMVRWTSMRSVMVRIVSGLRFAACWFSVFPDRVYRPAMLNHVQSYTAGRGQPPLLRRAVAFIHANVQSDIGLSDIAAAVGVTPRSVQYMFRRHLGTTPLEYLRRLRLDLAHRDLQAADPAVDTVTAIAGRWGFTHAGRFSIAHKQAFGIKPSRTLHDWPIATKRPPGE